MKAEVISVGTEVLTGQIVDTNGPWLSKLAAECGLECEHRQAVDDDLSRITAALKLALTRSDLIITVGGIGPTFDDMTRDAVAAAADDHLVSDPQTEQELRDFFKMRGASWAESNLKQAQYPSRGRLLDNPHGTAKGIHVQTEGKHIFALPGPPKELIPMAERFIKPLMQEAMGSHRIYDRILRTTGIGESALAELIKDSDKTLAAKWAPYAKPGEVHLRLSISSNSEETAIAHLNELEQAIRSRASKFIYSTGQPLEQVAADQMVKMNLKLAIAESCTGGMVSSRFTDVEGASRVFLGAVVSYAIAVKKSILHVDPKTLEAHTAVSEATALEMAKGVRAALNSDVGISVTGVAGPGPDGEGNPEGLVWIALESPRGTVTRKLTLGGGRDFIRIRAAQGLLTLLWEHMRDVYGA